MIIGPAIGLGVKISLGQICIGIWKDSFISDFSEWVFCVEEKSYIGKGCMYSVIRDFKYSKEYGTTEEKKICKSIIDSLSPSDWVDISKIQEKMELCMGKIKSL